MISAKQLKASVLHWAIQGKLTDQRASDGNAAELLEKIFSEKIKAATATARAGKRAGKTVVPAKPTPIPPDEIPFQIPKNWTWCRLGNLATFHDGEKKSEKKLPNLDAKFLRGKSCGNVLHSGKFIPAGTTLILVDGENSGEIFSVPVDGYQGSTFKILKIADEVFRDYVELFIKKNHELFRESKKGAAIPHLNRALFQNIPFPLPPLAEQKRIVARVEKILAKLEDYAEAEKQLLAADGAFPQAIKKSVLAAAVAGKLTDQRASDGNAAELLEKIFSEKIKAATATARAGKRAGKTVVPAKPTPIPPDEIPFQIPKNWTWCRLGNLATFHDGEKKSEKKLPNLDAKFLRGKSCGNVLHSGKFIPAGTTLILVDGENSGEIFSVPVDGYQGSTFKILKIADEVFRDYVELFIKKNHELFRESKKGAAIPHLNRALFQNIPFPLPPLAEQKRIVARVEKILAALLPLSQDAGTVR